MALQLVTKHTPLEQKDLSLAPLADAADAKDERAFLAACTTIDWQQRTPEEFLQAIQWAFAAGAHMAARQLANRGAEYYPDSGELQRYARVLAPPRVVAANLPPDPATQANRDWLVSHGPQFRGKWVAVGNGELLGMANVLEELTEQFGIRPEILYTKVG
jgi:hypothetical protein